MRKNYLSVYPRCNNDTSILFMKVIKIFLCLYVSLGVMTLTYGARLNKGGPFIEMGIGTAKIQNCGIDDKGSDRECHGENRQISVGYISKMHTESDTVLAA